MSKWHGYAFCEPVVAGSNSPWCLRKITDKGLRPGGGVDSNSLCGRVKAPYGWDVDVPVTQDRVDSDFVCKRCLEVLRG